MGDRLTRIVTKTGDQGTTGLADGSRRSKHDIRVHCLGEVDELNAVLGICLSMIGHEQVATALLGIQHDLFDIGAELCQPGVELFSAAHLDHLNEQVASLNANLEPLKEFILPGGSTELAHLHLARTVCRRVERTLTKLNDIEEVNATTLAYINRLSDLLFILARYFAKESGVQEMYWRSEFSRLGKS